MVVYLDVVRVLTVSNIMGAFRESIAVYRFFVEDGRYDSSLSPAIGFKFFIIDGILLKIVDVE